MRTKRTSPDVLKMVYPTLEILDEVQQSNLVDLLEDCCDHVQRPGGALE
jgi:hypothetical protein